MRESETQEAAFGFPKVGAKRIAPLPAPISRPPPRPAPLPLEPGFAPDSFPSCSSSTRLFLETVFRADPPGADRADRAAAAAAAGRCAACTGSERPRLRSARRESPGARRRRRVWSPGLWEAEEEVTVCPDCGNKARKDRHVLHVSCISNVSCLIFVTLLNLVYMQHKHTFNLFHFYLDE